MANRIKKKLKIYAWKLNASCQFQQDLILALRF